MSYRWVVLAVLWLTLLVSYFDRVAIATALPFMKVDLGLSPTQLGLVSGALLLSYTLVQVPAGYLSDRFGQRRLIAVAIAWWTLFSVLTGTVTGGVATLVAVRFLMGAIWLTFAAFFFFGFVLYGLMSWLPTWLISYRGLPLAAAGVLSTTPYLAGTVGLLVGAAVCQRRFNHVRRRFIAAGYLLTAACIVATVLATGTVLMGVFLTLAGFFLYSGLGPFWSVPMDVVAPHEVGTWLGFINMGTQIAGFVGPVLIGALLQATGSFTPVLLAMIVSMVLAAVCLSLVRVPADASDAAAVAA
jgi:sugar phosphate permease